MKRGRGGPGKVRRPEIEAKSIFTNVLVISISIMMQYRGIMPLQRASRTCRIFRLITSKSSSNCCDGGVPPLEPLSPPAQGTVKEHFHHILIKLNTPSGEAISEEKPGHIWWPSKVER